MASTATAGPQGPGKPSDSPTATTAGMEPSGNASQETKTSQESNASVAHKSGRIADVVIGPAGFNYPHWRKGKFYPANLKQAEELSFFSSRFSGVEINNTFHGTPREDSFRRWGADSAKGFTFALKLGKSITHDARLKDVRENWNFFVDRAILLGEKLGPILCQLPPSLHRDDALLSSFCSVVEETRERLAHSSHCALTSSRLRVAIEFRSKEWFCDEVFAILRSHDIPIVEVITVGNFLPHCDVITASWCYTRFLHGQEADDFRANYTDETLLQYARKAVARRKKQLDQYIFFLNDVDARSCANSQTLMKSITDLCEKDPSKYFSGSTSLVNGFTFGTQRNTDSIKKFFGGGASSTKGKAGNLAPPASSAPAKQEKSQEKPVENGNSQNKRANVSELSQANESFVASSPKRQKREEAPQVELQSADVDKQHEGKDVQSNPAEAKAQGDCSVIELDSSDDSRDATSGQKAAGGGGNFLSATPSHSPAFSKASTATKAGHQAAPTSRESKKEEKKSSPSSGGSVRTLHSFFTKPPKGS